MSVQQSSERDLAGLVRSWVQANSGFIRTMTLAMQFVILVGQWAHTEGEQAVDDVDRLENFCEFLAKVVKLDFWVLGRRASCSLQGIPNEALSNITTSSIGALPTSRRGLNAVLELPLYIVQCELRAATALVEEWLLLTEHGSELEIHVALLKEALCDLTLIIEGARA